MRRVPFTKPLKELYSIKDIDDSFIPLEYWDPYFWEKVTHVLVTNSPVEHGLSSHFDYFMKLSEAFGQLGAEEGYVYIFVSDQQEGLCKIGYTERTPEERLEEINRATGVIYPWKLYDAFPCRSPKAVEQLVHKALSEARVVPRKEGFAVYPKVAQEIISRIINSSREKFLYVKPESNA